MNIFKRISYRLLLLLDPNISEKIYIQIRYLLETGKYCNINNPKGFNEKLQWLKLNNRYSLLTDLVDKIKVKEYIKEKIGEKYVIPTLRIWNNSEEINEDEIEKLPNNFVLKTNHSGGNTGVIIIKKKNEKSIILSDIQNKLNRSLKSDLYKLLKEWPYKNVKRKIFAEEFLGNNLIDYKFFCFDGNVDSVMICLGRQYNIKPRFYFFDKNWNLLRYNKAGVAAPQNFTYPKPKNIEEMFDIAARLSEGFPFVRVDLYNVDGEIYFGELTFYPDSGYDENLTKEADILLGNKIDLSKAISKV